MAALRTPRCSSFFASASAPCLVRQNTMVGPATADDLGGDVRPRSPRSTAQKWCVAARLVGLREQVARRVASGTGARAGRPRRRAWRRTAASGASLGVRSSKRLHGGQEAHVGHAVGFVDHDHLDLVEVDLATLDEVGEAAGTGDEHVDAAAQRLELRAEAGAAVDGRDAAACGRRPSHSSSPQTWAASSRVGHEDEAARALRTGACRRARRAGCRTRWSCPSRSGRGRRGRGRRGRRARSWPGWGTRRSSPRCVEGADELGGNAELGEGGAGHGWWKVS